MLSSNRKYSPAGKAGSWFANTGALIVTIILVMVASVNCTVPYGRPKRDNPPLIFNKRRPEVKSDKTASTQAPQPHTIVTAWKAYLDVQWDKAGKSLIIKLRRGEVAQSDQWTAYILLGAMAYQEGRSDDALKYFTKASRQNSGKRPSTELFPPPMIEFYESIRKKYE
jgi:hypothetical protein